MTTNRKITGILAGAGLVAAIAATAGTGLQAQADGEVLDTVAPQITCQQATFSNANDFTVHVRWGTANSGDVTSLEVPAGETRSVDTGPNEHFWWSSSRHADPNVPGGELSRGPDHPGLDATAPCA